MRFAIAVGILVQAFPATSDTKNHANIHSTRADVRKQRVKALLQKPAAGRGAPLTKLRRDHDQSIFASSGGKKKHQGILKNTFATRDKVNCDPSSSDADVGLLSCGLGQYCMESEGSRLGGYCTHASSMDTSRQLQDEATGLLRDYCDPESPSYGLYDCDCSGFDLKTGYGTIECQFYDNYCLEYCNSTCTNITDTSTIEEGGDGMTTYCYDFFSPYNQTVCYIYDLSKENCEISLDGVTCNSCDYKPYDIYSCPDTGPCFNYTRSCVEFDCSNTPGMTYGSNCDGSYVAPIIGVGCYIFNLTDPFFCSICEDGEITIPDGIVSLPNQTGIACSALEDAAKAGEITEMQCTLLQPVAQEPCGCIDPRMTSSPTPALSPDVPTPAPLQTDAPDTTPAPVANPTPPPTDGVSTFLSANMLMSMTVLPTAVLVYFAG